MKTTSQIVIALLIVLLFNMSSGFSQGSILGRCDVYTDIFCGVSLPSQTTIGAGNDFTITDYPGLGLSGSPNFNGPDRLYKLQVTQQSSYHFVLQTTSSGVDLDMFLLTSCLSPAVKSATTESVSSATREVIDVNLTIGTYYLIVDGDSGAQGNYTLTVDCNSTCLEDATDFPPTGNQYWSDNFEQYNSGQNLDPQSTRWRKWSTPASGDALIATEPGGNKYARFIYSSSKPSELIYSLSEGNVQVTPGFTSGKYRLSWKMQVNNGKRGYFNVLHANPNVINGIGADVAYQVYFNRTTQGQGEVYIPNLSGIKKTFDYAVNTWLNVVNIIDLDKDSAQLWIQNIYVGSWKFSTSSTGTDLKQLAGIDFYAGWSNTYDFNVDQICVWQKKPGENCDDQPGNFPVCTQDGKKYYGTAPANCDLYSSLEFDGCESICDFGGTFIYRSEPRNGTFDYSDRAPGRVRDMSCVVGAYGGNVPKDLYAHIYVFYHDDKPNLAFLNWNTSSSNTKCFLMKCQYQDFVPVGQNSGLVGNSSSAVCLYGDNCLAVCSPFSSTTIYSQGNTDYSQCDDFYYIVVTGTLGESYSGLSIFPESKCGYNPPELKCGDVVSGNVDYDPFLSEGYFAAGVTGGAYNCYNGQRLYGGGEAFYKLQIDQPSKITVTLQSTKPMGVFLSSFVCGNDCIKYAGTLPGSGIATLNATLQGGIYYLIVDEDVLVGEDAFQISLDCQNVSLDNPFLITTNEYENPVACPPNFSLTHQIKIPNIKPASITFDTSDRIQLLYPLPGGGVKSTTQLLQACTSLPPFPFYIQALGDLTGDPDKCGFNTNDTIYIRRLQKNTVGSNNYVKIKAIYAPVGGGGNNANGRFKENGNSEIVELLQDGATSNFAISSSQLFFVSQPDSFKIQVQSSLPWKLDTPPSWLKVTPANSQSGPRTVVIKTLTANTAACPRKALLRFSTLDGSYTQYAEVEQAGICQALPTPSMTATPSNSICRGDSVTLSAPNLSGTCYVFQWSTGQTSQTIKVAPQSNATYSVTITNPNNCDRYSIGQITVTLKTPPTISATGGLINCQIPNLVISANSNAGPSASYSWAGPNAFSGVGAQQTVSSAGVYTVTVTSLTNGCTNSTSSTVLGNFTQPQITTTGGTLTCTVNSVQISASSNPSTATYSWSGPNNFSSIISNPTVSLSGPYIVTVTNTTNGCTKTGTATVTGNNAVPIVTTTGATLSCNASSVQILATVNNVPNPQFAWSGPNNFSSNISNPMVTLVGTYTVTVTNPDNNCTAVQTAQVIPDNNTPNISIVAGNNAIISCSQPAIDLLGNSSSNGVSYSWKLPNGTVVNNQKNLTQVAAPGLYTLTVKYNSNGCTASQTVNVILDNTVPDLSVISSGQITCNSDAILTASSQTTGLNWNWTGPNNFNSSSQNPQVNKGGTYLLTASAPNGCTATAQVNVVEDKTLPIVSIVLPQILTCLQTSIQLNASGSSQGSNFQYLWTTADGHISGSANVLNATIDQPGAYNLMVTNTLNGCTNTASTVVLGSVELPVVNAGPSKTITCSQPLVQLMATVSTGNYAYSWSGPGIVSGVSSLAPFVNLPGVYVITVTNNTNQCTSSSSVTVLDEKTLPAVGDLSPQTITCANNRTVQLSFSTTNAVTAAWYNPNNQLIGQNISVTVAEQGLYALIVTLNSSGCSVTKTVTVQLDTVPPTGSAGVDKVICSGNSWVLGQGNSPAYLYNWVPAGSLDNASTPSPQATPTQTQTYFVIITNPSNQCTQIDAVKITISEPISLLLSETSSIICAGDATGGLLAVASGGTPPLQYAWSNNQTGKIINGLGNGIYTVTVTDFAMCANIATISLDEPAVMIGDPGISPASPGLNDGAIGISVSGGVSPYTYIWYLNNDELPGKKDPIITNLGSTTGYSVKVTDAKGCMKTFGPFSTVSDWEPVLTPLILVYPNPSSGAINLDFDMQQIATSVEITILDVLGQEIYREQGRNMQRGKYNFDLASQPAGLYFLVLKADGAVFARPVSIIK